MKFVSYPTRRRVVNNDFNRFFNAFAQPTISRKSNKPTPKTAAVNVLENDDNFIIELAAPGWSKADFSIDLENEVLTISAKKEQTEAKEGEKFLRCEFAATELKRTFSLPDTIEQNNIVASFKNGILTLTLPKKEEAKPVPARKVEIA